MSNLKTPLKVLGILAAFVLLFVVVVIAYLAITKPFGIKIQNIPNAIIKSQSGETKTSSNNPLLTPEQETTLENLGVDASMLPTSISPELLSCFSAALGSERVKEIESGSSLTMTDYFKVESCITVQQ